MRGVLVKEYTEFENLTLEDCPRPELKPRHVRIKTQAAGVSFATSLVVAGKYQRKPPLPFVPGTEAAGYVTELAEGVTRFKVGDRVTAVVDWAARPRSAPPMKPTPSNFPTAWRFTKLSASPTPIPPPMQL